MGMAASQARFLMLTARLSNIEFEGQQINQARSELADKTARAASEYQQAMTNRRLLFDPRREAYNDNNNYQVFTYDSIVKSFMEGGLGMRLVNKDGKIIVPHLPSDVFEGTAEANDYIIDEKVYDSSYLEYNLRNSGWNLQKGNAQVKSSWTEYDIADIYAEKMGLGVGSIIKTAEFEKFKEDFNYDNITDSYSDFGFNLRLVNKEGKEVVARSEDAKTDNYIVDSNLTDKSYFQNLLNTNQIKINFEEIITFVTNWINADWRSTEGIFDTPDKTDDGAAEAKYTELTAKYQAQDKKLEMRQKQLDSEHSALQTEYDAVKKVIDKNVETTFKTFG